MAGPYACNVYGDCFHILKKKLVMVVKLSVSFYYKSSLLQPLRGVLAVETHILIQTCRTVIGRGRKTNALKKAGESEGNMITAEGGKK